MAIGFGIVIVVFGGGRNPLFTPIFIAQMEYGITGILMETIGCTLTTSPIHG
jgi:hypothetical protein